jgi:CMP/dCMP kinase
MIITISGFAGSGKTTVGRDLSKRLKYNFYDIGTLRKKVAKERGMTIEEYNILGEKDHSTDKDADNETIKLAKTEDNFVIQGRVAYYFIPQSIKIFLTVNPDVAAERISEDFDNPERNSASKVSSLDNIKRISADRDASDKRRYNMIYSIKDFTDPKNYDVYIDTSYITVDAVVKKILSYIDSKR